MHERAETSPKTVVLHIFHEKHVRNTKGFTLISGRVMRNPMCLHVCAPFSKNFNLLILGFFPEPRYDGRGYRNRAHVTHSQRTRKRARYCLRIMDFSGIIQILSSTSSYVKCSDTFSPRNGGCNGDRYTVSVTASGGCAPHARGIFAWQCIVGCVPGDWAEPVSSTQ